MKKKLGMIGNSLGFYISKKESEILNVKLGDIIEIRKVKNGN